VASLGLATAALGHPLGNYTVNRAVAVTLSRDVIGVRYVVDMAEIPAFAAVQAIDTDGDGNPGPLEERAWAGATCEAAGAALVVEVDGRRLSVAPAGDPALTFPAGAGGLETLRLECPLEAEWTPAVGEHAIDVLDRTDDGHVGWREVTIAAEGWALLWSTVPAVSPSGQLAAYPTDSLAAPPDIRSGMATFRVADASGPVEAAGAAAAGPRFTSEDPLAALIAGDLTIPVALVALFIAGGLGAVHALSPGHGKTLVAAYLLGSGGTLRQAAGLGITVAITHTLGVFALGAATLAAGELFVPERVVVWLSVASGALVALLGFGLVWRGLRAAHGRARHDHGHGPTHEHPYSHRGGRVERTSSLRLRSILALGLAGGMVPSASALIVLLAAVSTGRLLFGIGLIVAFGVGMAVVLAGLAAATTMARRAIVAPRGIASWPLARTVTGLLPVASGIVVLIIGSVVTLAALGRIG
jgi:ABC-type nickel/cobalt efflux system permease component RcnA